jgi:hypothetical protein
VKDFDEARTARQARERTFRIAGREFAYRASVAPERLIAWDQRGDAAGQDFLDIIDETVVAFLEPGEEASWREVRDPGAANPLNIGDIVDVIQWLFEEQVARPTGPPSGSTNGHASTVTPSTAASSSPVTPAA